MADLEIRRYRAEDALAVRRLSPETPPLQEVVEAGGEAWVAEQEGRLLAFAFAAPLPGLPGQVELCGCVDPDARRKGIGSRLLEKLLAILQGQGVRQVSCAVERLEAPTAQFLQAQGFTRHHEEWRMERHTLTHLPPVPTVPGCGAQTFPRRRAIRTFRRLYDASFSGESWYQPYTEEEIAAELQRAQDLLFWACEGKVVGFVWVHRQAAGVAEIEPVGMLPGARGRGYGRALLLAALHRLARQGGREQRVHLAVWRENTAAIELYRQLGFERSGRRYYLAYEVGQELAGP